MAVFQCSKCEGKPCFMLIDIGDAALPVTCPYAVSEDEMHDCEWVKLTPDEGKD